MTWGWSRLQNRFRSSRRCWRSLHLIQLTCGKALSLCHADAFVVLSGVINAAEREYDVLRVVTRIRQLLVVIWRHCACNDHWGTVREKLTEWGKYWTQTDLDMCVSSDLSVNHSSEWEQHVKLPRDLQTLCVRLGGWELPHNRGRYWILTLTMCKNLMHNSIPYMSGSNYLAAVDWCQCKHWTAIVEWAFQRPLLLMDAIWWAGFVFQRSYVS